MLSVKQLMDSYSDFVKKRNEHVDGLNERWGLGAERLPERLEFNEADQQISDEEIVKRFRSVVQAHNEHVEDMNKRWNMNLEKTPDHFTPPLANGFSRPSQANGKNEPDTSSHTGEESRESYRPVTPNSS